MTEQEKQLLLADLCARLPYNVRIRYYVNDTDFYSNPLMTYDIDQLKNNKAIIKPYLRPMSSITEEELSEYRALCRYHNITGTIIYEDTYKSFDWLNEYHFDYRGLIPMGLALEAPEGMYKVN